MEDITRWYMNDMRIMPSMGNRPTKRLRPRPSALIYKRQFYKQFWLKNDDPITA